MKIYAFICTRQEPLPDYTQKLLTYLSRCKIDVNVLIGKKSIFEAYKDGVSNIILNDDDIVIQKRIKTSENKKSTGLYKPMHFNMDK